MKILVLSDTHIGHPGWGDFGRKAFADATQRAQQGDIDVVLHCGDIVAPGTPLRLEDGLELLRAVPATHHLWVAGNNDIEFLPHKEVVEYPHILKATADPFGIHLLDAKPKVVGDVTFVGSFGFFNFRLWRKPRVSSVNYPDDFETLREKANDWHMRNLGYTVEVLFQKIRNRLHEHLESVQTPKVVVATHTVPSPSMVVYGHSPAYDFQNAWMGWDDEAMGAPISKTPGLALQVCGHIHRSKTVDRPGCVPLINVSGQDQPSLFEV